MTNTATLASPVTPEVLARRQRIQELRDSIKKFAEYRRMIKAAYSLNHQGQDHPKMLASCRTLLGIQACSWEQHCVPSRTLYRDDLTAFHVELANLRGKQHIQTPS